MQLVWFAKKKITADGLLGIETGPEGIALARVLRVAGETPRLLDCQFRQAVPAEQPAVLKTMVAELGLAGVPVNLVLHPATYQMLLLDCPDVPADELFRVFPAQSGSSVELVPINAKARILALIENARAG